MQIGYHASHEQFTPSDLLECARLSETAGFDGAMCSDHFSPFSVDQGSSGFAWSWLGAVLQATGLSFGTVTAPGYRYHPVVVAQSIATLGQMYPGRFWVALGSGQHINEHFVGGDWPAKSGRQQLLLECVGIIRSLLAGETVLKNGRIAVQNARLWVQPDTPVPLFGAALQPVTARWVATWADGLITIAQPPAQLRAVVDAFRQGGGEGKPLLLQAQMSLAESEAEAREAARREWRSSILAPETLEDMPTAQHMDGATTTVRAEDMDASVHMVSRAEAAIEWLRGFEEMGFDRVYVHNVNRNQREYVELFGDQVLPALRKQG